MYIVKRFYFFNNYIQKNTQFKLICTYFTGVISLVLSASQFFVFCGVGSAYFSKPIFSIFHVTRRPDKKTSGGLRAAGRIRIPVIFI